jgi:hypothetical protein
MLRKTKLFALRATASIPNAAPAHKQILEYDINFLVKFHQTLQISNGNLCVFAPLREYKKQSFSTFKCIKLGYLPTNHYF